LCEFVVGAIGVRISGRGLGHTGGTLDKLEAIPGYGAVPDRDLFRKVVQDCGVAIAGQTAALAPADKRFYATRDVTATVESIDLITASILSKKLAAGLEGLVMDVKVGSGAFMPSYEASKESAESIVKVSNGAGVKTRALLTDMNEPLASTAGNAVEVKECVAFLVKGGGNMRLKEVTFSLCSEMLVLGGLAKESDEALTQLEEALSSGRAAEVFGQMVAGLGGPSDFVEKVEDHLPKAQLVKPVLAEESGTLVSVDARELGMAVVEMGGGRRRAEDEIDHAVGLSEIAPLGTEMAEGEPLAMIHAKNESDWELASQTVRSAFQMGEDAEKRKVVCEVIS